MANPRLKGADTAIGFCIGQPNNDDINPLLLTHCADTGVRWLRWQPYWRNLEPVKNGGFHFGNLDSVVQKCNANGINITITAMLGFSLPSWQSSSPASASDYLRYGMALADRYNGNNGVGIIQGIEIGNEDFDQGSNKPYGPLATVMNTCYPPIKSKYPDLIIGPACSLQRNSSHINEWWRGMWRDAGGHFDFQNSHYYTGIPGGSLFSFDPSVTKGNVPSFPSNLQIIRQAASDAGHANFPLWITETGFAINNFDAYQCGTTVTTQATQRDFLKYELDQLQAINQPTKIFIYTMTYKSRAGSPQCGVGTTQGMSLYQTNGTGSGFTTLAYAMVKAYPKDWGGGSSIGTRQRDLSMRARTRTGLATQNKDLSMRARTKIFTGTFRDKDLTARCRFTGGIADTFVRSNQATWGTASNSEQWVQAGGTGTPSIVSNKGHLTGATGTNTMRLGAETRTDVEASVRVVVSRAGDIVGLTVRDTGLTNFVRLRLTASQLQIVQQTPTAFTTLASYAFAVAANTSYWLKFRVKGADMRGKIWEDGTAEPDWLLTANSGDVPGPGQVGLSVALSNSADTAQFDSYNCPVAAFFSPPPVQKQRDLSMRAGVIIPTFTQLKDVAMRARIVDTSGISIEVFAANRPPIDRRFPKS